MITDMCGGGIGGLFACGIYAIVPSWAYSPWFIGAMVLFVVAYWIWSQFFAPISPLSYATVLFVGRKGQGKTFGMVSYIRRARHFDGKRPVYTNLDELRVPGSGPVHVNCTPKQIMQAKDAIVAIDEAGVFLNSMEFFDITQQEVARWIAAGRHEHNLILMTAHEPETVNRRVRGIVDEVFDVHNFQRFFCFRLDRYEGVKAFDGGKRKRLERIFLLFLPTVKRSYNTDSRVAKPRDDDEARTKRQRAAMAAVKKRIEETPGMTVDRLEGEFV